MLVQGQTLCKETGTYTEKMYRSVQKAPHGDNTWEFQNHQLADDSTGSMENTLTSPQLFNLEVIIWIPLQVKAMQYKIELYPESSASGNLMAGLSEAT